MTASKADRPSRQAAVNGIEGRPSLVAEADGSSVRLLRELPQLGEVLMRPELKSLIAGFSRELVADTLRTRLARLREQVRTGRHTPETLLRSLEQLAPELEGDLVRRTRPSLRRVINASGTILQTNLGRAPLSQEAIRRVQEVGGGYCNLEVDLQSGDRSRRDDHVEETLLDVLALRGGLETQAFRESHRAIVVNNCAAATLLALDSLASGGEVIVSRGELVEIGGGFRVPDILRKSGAVLREVGTTNRTRASDYAGAITPQTRMILRVHQSNFKIEGFTERPSLAELVDLGARASVTVFEDQGTGSLVDIRDNRGARESSLLESARTGVPLVASSGDKLLGGPQCGLLVGASNLIETLRSNPLFRAVRVDKLTYAALEATLLAYLTGRELSLPTIAMLRCAPEQILVRCETVASALASDALTTGTVPTESVIGGGTTPGTRVPGYAVELRHARLTASRLGRMLRSLDPPVIGRISDEVVLLDLRTVAPEDDPVLIGSVRKGLLGAESL